MRTTRFGGRHLSVSGWGVLCPGGPLSGGSLSGGLYLEGDPLSHVNRMTDASKNITLPKTSFAAKGIGLCLSVRQGCR